MSGSTTLADGTHRGLRWRLATPSSAVRPFVTINGWVGRELVQDEREVDDTSDAAMRCLVDEVADAGEVRAAKAAAKIAARAAAAGR